MKGVQFYMQSEKQTYKNNLYVVLIPGGKVLKLTKNLQKKISGYYKIYEKGSYPQIHITINKVEKKHEKDLTNIIDRAIKHWNKKIEIAIEDFDCYFTEKNRFLVLKISRTRTLVEFSELLQQKLINSGINTINNYNRWNYHITLISSLFAENQINYKDFTELCILFKDLNFCPVSSEVQQLEIWRPVLDKTNKIIKKYFL